MPYNRVCVAIGMWLIIGFFSVLVAVDIRDVHAFYQENYKKIAVGQSADSMLLTAHALIKRGQLKRALHQLDSIELTPDQTVYKTYLMFQIAIQKGQLDRAEQLVMTVSDSADNGLLKSHMFVQLADYFESHDHVALAVRYYEKLLQRSRDSRQLATVHFRLWVLYMKQNKDHHAVMMMKQLLTQYPEWVDHDRRLAQWPTQLAYQSDHLSFLLGVSYYKQRDYQEALNQLSKLKDRQSDYYQQARVYRGLAYYFQYDFGKAIHVFRQFSLSQLRASPDDTMIYLARSYQRLGHRKQATIWFKHVLKTDSRYKANAYYYLYDMYRQSDLKKAMRYATALRSKFPKSSFVNKLVWGQAVPLIKKKQWQAANTWLTRVSLVAPDTMLQSQVLYWKAKSWQFLGDHRQAMQGFQEVVKQFPYSYYAYQTIHTKSHQLDVDRLKPAPLRTPSILPHYQFLVTIGLADVARQDSQYQLNQASEDQKAVWVYQLSYIYQLMGDYYESIWTLRRHYDRAAYPQHDMEISDGFMSLLYPQPYLKWVKQYATYYRIDPWLVMALIREESLFKTDGLSRSRAVGLMQIMPTTGRAIAKELGVTWTGVHLLEDPEINIRFGCYYIAKLRDQFTDWHRVLMAYNAGPGRVRQWLKTGIQDDNDMLLLQLPYSETHHYVKRVLQSYWVYDQFRDTFSGP